MAVSTDRLTGGRSPFHVASDESYRDLLSLSPAPMVLFDADGRTVLSNEPAVRLFAAADEAALSGLDFLSLVAPDEADVARRMIAALRSGDTEPLSTRLVCRRSDGTTFAVEVAGRPAPRQTGDAFLCVFTKIDAPISKAPTGGSASDDMQDRLLEAIEAMPEGVALYDADERLVMFNSNYRRTIWPGLKDFIQVGVRFEQIVRETLRRNVWELGRIDPETFAREALARHRDVPSVHDIVNPDGRVIRQSKRRTSDGGTIAVYTDITEFRRREADINETQDRHRRLLETLPDGVVIHSGGKFAYVNPALIEIYGGKSHTDLIGRNSVDFIPPEDRAGALERLERILTARITLAPQEQRRIRLDGQIIHVEVRHAFIQWNGKPAVLSVIRDLTERKRAEHSLREAERRYLTIASNLPGAVYQRVMHPDGTINFPYVSRGVIETHGLDAEAVKRHGSLLVRAIHPEDRERFSRALAESAQNLTPFDIEVRNVKPDGEVVWIRSLARPRAREDGAILWDGLFVDVTARRQAEERAAQTSRWLKDAIDSLSDGFVLWDAEDRLVLWNDRFIEGHPQRGEIVEAGTPFERMLDLTSRSLGRQLDPAQLAEWRAERTRHHREARGSYEMMTSRGRWVLVTERRTQEGYTVGIYTDTTNRKRRADELKQSEERYRRLVQLSPDAIFVHIGGRVVFANETAVTLMAAASPADLVGRDILDFTLPEERIKILSRQDRLTDTALPTMLETRYVRLDKVVRHCESSVSRIRWQGEDAYLVVIRDIEERVDAQRQQAILAAVLDQAADAIEVAGPDCSLLYVNPAYERMMGYSLADVAGRKAADVLDPEKKDLTVYQAIESAMRSGRSWNGLLPGRRKDGTEFRQEATISPVFDEHGSIKNFVAIKRDITDRIRTEEALRESEDRYRKLLALTPDAIYVHVEGVLVLVNAAAVEAFGAENEADLVGRPVLELMHEDFREKTTANMRRVLAENVETLRIEQRRLRLDGSEFWASASITPLAWKGERGALVILRDVTEQRKAREELVRAMEAAEIANKSKSEFLANMSHELRTPLNAIIGFSEIMQNEMFGPLGAGNYTEYARDIHESGMHLLHVINDILDLSKIEAGKLAINLSEVDLAETVAASVRFIAKIAKDADVSIETRIAAGLPRIQADQRMLKQMLMNLLSNSIKFTPSGRSIRISVVRAGEDHVKIAVTDTGIGIPREDLSRVLEPFIQVDAPSDRPRDGTGLGLPLTKSLAELHGGTFQIWSRLGTGTKATVRLPITAARR